MAVERLYNIFVINTVITIQNAMPWFSIYAPVIILPDRGMGGGEADLGELDILKCLKSKSPP